MHLVTENGSGDGDGTFYLPGGKKVPQQLLDETRDFADKVRIHAFKDIEIL